MKIVKSRYLKLMDRLEITVDNVSVVYFLNCDTVLC